MKRSKFSDNQILAVLKQSDVGTARPDLCREHGIAYSAAPSPLARSTCDGRAKTGRLTPQ
jgi:putative transposase